MTLENIKKLLHTEEYDFLRTDEHLKENVILLCLGGSHAYGTSNEGSDVDVRGIALNTKNEILLGQDFEQVCNVETDTTVYSFKKIVQLLMSCNPNTIEEMGCKPDHYLYLSPIGKELIAHKKLFLSRRAADSFGGYANQQLYRLMQKSKNYLSQSDLEKHILKTLENQMKCFPERYAVLEDDSLKLYVDDSEREDFDTEIYMDIQLSHYPLRDYASLWNELQNTVKSYNKIGKRNSHALEHGKISKHMMHLVRLYLMCFDILERGEIITYREKEHAFLMEIRNGKFIDENNIVLPEFFEIVKNLEKRFEYDKENTCLPDKPNVKEINEFVADVNERVILGKL